MSKKNATIDRTVAEIYGSDTPVLPTTKKMRYSGGRVVGTGGGTWLYRKVPLGPIVDARSDDEAILPPSKIVRAIQEISTLGSPTIRRRQQAKSTYREIHMLLINLKRRYSPPMGSRIRDELDGWFGNQITQERVLLFGVRLRDTLGGGHGFRSAMDSIATSLATAEVPISDYDIDYAEVDGALARCDFEELSAHEFDLADSWWAAGDSPDSPILPHADHIHVFRSVAGAQQAARSGTEDGQCKQWPDLPGHHTLRMGSVHGFDLDFESSLETRTQWASILVANDAAAISIRARVEPSDITASELRKNRSKYREDIRDRHAQGKMDDAQQKEKFATLEMVENAYKSGKASATLIDASIVAAFTGNGAERMETLGNGRSFTVSSMDHRQQIALPETWVASHIRANPNLVELPAVTAAYSGIADLSMVGDRSGALAGFTIHGRQPAYISATRASDDDTYPIAAVVGSSGAGKSMVMAFLAEQFNLEGRPGIVIDPKPGSDFSKSFSNPTVYSLDEFIQGEGDIDEGGSGVFDPMRFSASPQDGINTAVSMLHFASVWPSDRTQNFEADLKIALRHGAKNGCRSIGTSLLRALADKIATPEMAEPIIRQAQTDPMFGACVGLTDDDRTLRAADGLTYIKVGNSDFDLPAMGADQSTLSLTQRVSVALVRMMVFGSAAALRDRRGFLMLDEAWVFLGAGQEEVERLGRLARSQQVFPMMFTQRISDVLEANIQNHISSGIILHTRDRDEAKAAFDLFGVEPTKARMDQTTAMDSTGRKPIFATLPNGERGRVLRGSVGLYCDANERAVDIEIRLPDDFLQVTSTNARDRARREGREIF